MHHGKYIKFLRKIEDMKFVFMFYVSNNLI